MASLLKNTTSPLSLVESSLQGNKDVILSNFACIDNRYEGRDAKQPLSSFLTKHVQSQMLQPLTKSQQSDAKSSSHFERTAIFTHCGQDASVHERVSLRPTNENFREADRTRGNAITCAVGNEKKLILNTMHSQPQIRRDKVNVRRAFDDNYSLHEASGTDDECRRRKRHKNEKEKERSLKISNQINELQEILLDKGIHFVRGTKRSVLTEAINYIRNLENSLQNKTFDLLTPTNDTYGKRINSNLDDGKFQCASEMSSQSTKDTLPAIYKCVFQNSCSPMAIISLAGIIIDCNESFFDATGYTDREDVIRAKATIFNLIARDNLFSSFERMYRLIVESSTETITFKGIAKKVVCSLRINLIHNESGPLQYFLCSICNG